MLLPLGERVGRYVVAERIGVGPRGAVYRATRVDGGERAFALKLVRPESSLDLAQLVAAARSAAALDHPNIAAVVEVGTHDACLFVARELVRGTPISAHTKALRADRIRWLITAAGALHTAHRRCVVHGAVREGNVLIEEDGTLKLTDFAIGDARSMGDDRRAWIDLANAILETSETTASIRDALEAAAGENGSLDRAASMLEEALDDANDARDVPDAHASAPVDLRPEKAIVPAGTLRTQSRDPAPASRFAIVALIIACSLVVLYATGRESLPGATEVSAAGAPIGSRASATAPIRSPQAIALFNGAMQSMRDASIDQARTTLDEALRIDPSFAAAHLRRALLSIMIDDTSREHFRRAMSLRNSLTPHERVLLEAFEPAMAGKPIFAQSVERMEAAQAESPNDADFAFHMGFARWLGGDFRGALAEMDRTLGIDARFALASRTRAFLLLSLNRAREAIDEYERCLVISPAATRCLANLADVRAREGDCEKAEELSRRTIAVDPESTNAYYMLAVSLAAEHKDEAASLTAEEYDRRASFEGDPIRSFEIEEQLAILRGDFDQAERTLDAWDRAVASKPNEWAHYAPTERRIEIYLETGRSREAIAVGNAVLTRHAALTKGSSAADARILVLGAMHRANGATNEMLETLRHEARVALDGAGAAIDAPTEKERAWIYAYTTSIATPDDARAALKALTEYPPLPPEATRNPIEVDGMIGRAFWLAGQPDQAAERLARSARSCLGLDSPLFHTQSLALLADVERAQGKTSQACADYGEVLRRWGAARRSRTALTAKSASAALHCEP